MITIKNTQNQSAIRVSNKTYVQLKNLKNGGSAAFLAKDEVEKLCNVLREASGSGTAGGVAIFMNADAREAGTEKWVNYSLAIAPATGTAKKA